MHVRGEVCLPRAVSSTALCLKTTSDGAGSCNYSKTFTGLPIACCVQCAERRVAVQVLRGGDKLPQARRDAMAAASDAKEFVSHCATDGADTVTPSKMTVAQLRAALLV